MALPSSTVSRLLYVVAAIWCISIMGGAVYGWPSMRAILLRDGVLRSAACVAKPAGAGGCHEQELAFNFIFTLGAWSNQGGRLVVGIILDYIGPRWTSTACALTFSVGAVVFGLAETREGMAAGFFLVGLGGAGMQLAVQSVSVLFPKNRSTVMSSLSGAFQAASGVYLIFDALNRNADIPRQGLLWAHAGAALATAVLSALIWPSRPFEQPSGDAKGAQLARPTSLLQWKRFREQVLSREYILMTALFSVHVVQCQFTVGTVGTQFELKGDTEGSVTRAFNTALACSFIFTPILGQAIDRAGFPAVLAVVNTSNIATCVCLLFNSLELQYLTCGFYSLGRVGLWATFFSFMGKIFGFNNYGKLAGFGLMFASTCSLVQYPLLDLTLGPLREDFRVVNGLFAGLGVLAYGLVASLACRLRALEQQAAQGAKSASEEHGNSEQAEGLEEGSSAPATQAASGPAPSSVQSSGE